MNRCVALAGLLLLGCVSRPLAWLPESAEGDDSAGETDAGGASDAGRDGARDAALPCTGTATWDCINGCSTGHVIYMQICQGGVWVCPPSSVPTATCGGSGDCALGSHPTCPSMGGVMVYPTCNDKRWFCPNGNPVGPGPTADAAAPL